MRDQRVEERRPERQRGLRNYGDGYRNGFRARRVQTAEGGAVAGPARWLRCAWARADGAPGLTLAIEEL